MIKWLKFSYDFCLFTSLLVMAIYYSEMNHFLFVWLLKQDKTRARN